VSGAVSWTIWNGLLCEIVPLNRLRGGVLSWNTYSWRTLNRCRKRAEWLLQKWTEGERGGILSQDTDKNADMSGKSEFVQDLYKLREQDCCPGWALDKFEGRSGSF